MDAEHKSGLPLAEARSEAYKLIGDICTVRDPEHPMFPHWNSALLEPEAHDLYVQAVDISNISEAPHLNAWGAVRALRDEIFKLQERGTPGQQKCFIWVAPGQQVPDPHPSNCICKEIDAKIVTKQAEIMAAREKAFTLMEAYYLCAARQIRDRLPKLKADAETLRKRLRPDLVEERELAAANALRQMVAHEHKAMRDAEEDIALSKEARAIPEVALALERVKATYSAWDDSKDAVAEAKQRMSAAHDAYEVASEAANDMILKTKAELRKRKKPSEDAAKAEADGDVVMGDAVVNRPSGGAPPKKKPRA
jgi:hypothetical protein